MRRFVPTLTLAVLVVATAAGRPDDPKAASAAPAKEPEAPVVTQGFVKFRIQEIEKQLRVGYCVVVADVNGDGKPDIIVADTDRIVWYENPTWKRRTMIENKKDPKTGEYVVKKTEPDNVSMAAADIDGDGKIDFFVAAGWTGRFDGKTPGTLQWIRRGKTLEDPWELIPIPCEEPSVHRIRLIDLDDSGKPQLVVAPLMGRDSTRTANWMDGRPVKILTYKIPADPVKGPWKAEVFDESLHVVHSVAPVQAARRKGFDVLAASYEGVTVLARDPAGQALRLKVGEGNQRTPSGPRGSSEAKLGALRGTRFISAVEPWHGGQVVVYTPGGDVSQGWDRKVIDEKLRWGHAVVCADLDGDGSDEIVVGVRDDPARGDNFTERRGVRIYRAKDPNGRTWDSLLVDEGGVAVEDLTVADLNGDGRPDIIAVGRQTGNVKIYWNQK
jgi:hypothetical protein